ncbi:cell division protein FtsQ/DivIB [Thermodesulfobacteriota bacterium]
MSGRKNRRKNIYKNSIIKRRDKIKQRFYDCFKTVCGVAFLLFVSAVFIFGYDLLTQCDYFSAESVIVKGANRLSEEEILKQSCVKQRMNILSINLSKTRKRLLAHSWIAEAEVSRELPATITIRIKEHEPLAVLDLGRKFLIDARGEIFKERTASDPDDLPVITGLEYSDLDVSRGDDASFNEERGREQARRNPLAAVMDVLRLGQEPDSVIPNRFIESIYVDREIGLTLHASYYAPERIRAIKLGYNDYSSKYVILKNILFHLKKRDRFPDFDSIDLNNVNRIVVNPVKVESPAGNHKEV